MARFITRRLAQALVVLFGVSIVVFVLVRITGDPTALLVSADARPEDIERYRTSLGLDRPWHEQYLHFVGHALRGDFGNSFRHREPAIALVLERIPNTLMLTGAAMLLAYSLPILAGLLSAMRPNTALDALIRGIAICAQAAPSFWLGLVLMMIFSVRLDWLPPTGSSTLRGIILPAITLSAFFMATNVRLLRSSMLEVLSRDYVRTARAKGLSESLAIRRHAFKNAAIPLVTMAGIQFASMIGGAIVTETVFAYPGMGLLAIQSIQSRDYPVIQAFVLVSAITIVVVNLLIDLAYVWLDPRIGLEG
ncbi:MAG: ABC transporter permease [Thermomicrobiales bacterium]|nr:ABC transporter permease [Thermomicrobiales bacterium]MCO5220636.1 ABC transporter permease [Thermomicrobiales bacterium]